ncbi:MAG TPA: acetate--CoA ligase family protein, partial [Quisquiliibacterium sp.]|nr:acetate--CoA ligase family protein [Quisquiliibacterium sp.]
PFLHQAGVVSSIALTFVPQLIVSARDIREAQRIRGHRFRGRRDMLPLIVPLLTMALERAIGLAESMESRGFGDGTAEGHRHRGVLLSGLLLTGLALRMYWAQRPLWGIVMLAAGGVLAEVYRDRSLRLAPVDLAGAHAMIGEVRAMAALRGFRGRPAGDLDALAEAIVRLSGIAQRPELGVVEAEINPLIVHRAGEGVTAVDAVVWIADDERGDV